MPSHALRTTMSASAPVVAPEEASTPATKRRTIVQRLLALLTVVVAVAALGACAAPSSRGQQVANIALGQVGKPYAYGGTGPNSFDCSGLVQFSYGRAGLGIPRTTESQLAAAHPVPQSAARPGDVIFFGNYHVGVYVGGGQMVDAPKPGSRVTERPMWTNAYTVGRF